MCILICCLFSCQKTDSSFPQISTNGSNQLGFYVNHSAWTPSSDRYFDEDELPIPLIEDGVIKIAASRIDEKNSARDWFCLQFNNPELKQGLFPINEEGCSAVYQTHYYGQNSRKESKIYNLNPSNHNFVEVIKLDTVSGVIAGTFSLSAISNLEDTIRISSGRFDLKF